MFVLALALLLPTTAMAAVLDGPANFGTTMATGDFDGDGIQDLAVAAPMLDLVWIFYGGEDDLSWTHTDRLAGDENGAWFGGDMDVGDLNGDGIDDLVVGAHESRDGDGCISTWHGGTAGIASSPAFTSCSDRGDINLGAAVAVGGDLDDDGALDLVVGSSAPFMAVYFGGTEGFSDDARSYATSADVYFSGNRVEHAAGVGDLTGDGVDDALIADEDATGGRLLVIAGDPDGIRDDLGRPSTLVTAGRTRALIGGSDLNGDGHDDALATIDTLSRCLVYLYAGEDSGGEVVLEGDDTSTCHGYALAITDLDNDGRLDIVASAPDAEPPAVHLLYGTSDGFVHAARPLGSECIDDGGRSLAVLDLNADGYPEIAVGDPGTDAGRVHILAGGLDQDRDGAVQPDDCDDGDPTVYPGAEEIIGDGVDQDCDGRDAAGDTAGDDTAPPKDTDPAQDTGDTSADDACTPCDSDEPCDDDGRGCGCGSPGAPTAAGLLGLALLGLARSRRRRGRAGWL